MLPRLYGYRWQQSSKLFLKQHPLCRFCDEQGIATPATIVDHRVPHKGDLKLFWDQTNWQPLCKTHHDSTKQAQERRGYAQGCDADGWPTDLNHPIHGGYIGPETASKGKAKAKRTINKG